MPQWLCLLALLCLVASQSAVCGSHTEATDSDGDGICDALEIDVGTNPNTADSDGDGISYVALK